MRVLVIGGTGATGRRTSAELARSNEVTELLVGGRDPEVIERLTSLLGDKVHPAMIDTADRAELIAACRRAQVVVSCAGPAHEMEVATAAAAVEAGASYVSLCDDYDAGAAVAELDRRAQQAGVVVISGCGLAPGITSMLAQLAQDELDEVDEILISLALSYGDLPTPAHTRHLVHAMSSPAAVISDGKASLQEASTSPQLIYFPEPVGWVETVAWAHPEVHNFHAAPLRALSVRCGLTERAAMDALRAARSAPLSSTSFIRRTLDVAHTLPPRGPQWSAARVDVVGTRRGRTVTVSLGVVDHLVNLASAPLALAAQRLGSGSHEPGVKSPAEAFDARSFLVALGRRGTRVARLEPVPI